MFDFSKVHSSPINKEFVLKQVSEAQIFSYYFGSFKIGYPYPSVFRRDRTPSTNFFINRAGHLLYHDFGTGDNWDCFSFVATLFSITYGDAIRKIASDFGLIDPSLKKVNDSLLQKTDILDTKVKKKTKIQINAKRFSEEELLYWKQYEITAGDLKRDGQVFSVKELFIGEFIVPNKGDHMRFAFIENFKGKEYTKVYSPTNKYMKWISNFPLSIPFNYEKLDRSSDTCIITKSKKDQLVLRKIFPSVIATQNESVSALPEEIQKDLLSTFKRCIIFWDNDETGVTNCKKLNDLGFGYFNIPKNYLNSFGIKDASDYVSYYGLDALKELLREKQLL
jgi:hypothetical protein